MEVLSLSFKGAASEEGLPLQLRKDRQYWPKTTKAEENTESKRSNSYSREAQNILIINANVR